MHTILVADDSVTIQRAAEIAFDKEPFVVVKAGSALEALTRAKETRPSLVLVDHTLPDQSGYELALALRSDAATAQIPVLLLSAAAHPYDENRARAAGIVGHVVKPFDCQGLLDRARAILGVAATIPSPAGSAAPGAAMPAGAMAAALPRPPGAPGSLPSSLPRPPTFGGGLGGAAAAQRPSGAPLSVPSVSPLAALSPAVAVLAAPARAATPLPAPPRAATPLPAREFDPFGFGAAVSTPPVSTPVVRIAEQEFVEVSELELTELTPSQPIASSPAFGAAWPAEAFAPAAAAAATEASQTRTLGPDDLVGADPLEMTRARIGGRDNPGPAASAATGGGMVDAVVSAAAPAIAAATGAAPDRQALSAEVRAIVERIVWEVVPELAEAIIKEELQRLLKSR